MIGTDINGRNLIAYTDTGLEVIVEIAPQGLDEKSTQAFLLDRKTDRKAFGYTIQEQINIYNNTFTPIQH